MCAHGAREFSDGQKAEAVALGYRGRDNTIVTARKIKNPSAQFLEIGGSQLNAVSPH